MIGEAFKASLLNIYHGEQFGEAFFSVLLADAKDDNERFILGALLQLETEGKAKLRPLLAKYGLPLDDSAAAIRDGAQTAKSIADEDWHSKFAAMIGIIEEQALPEYEGLIDKVSPQEDAQAVELAEFIGAHERIILQVCKNIVADTPDPTHPLNDFLHFPLTAKNST